MLLMGIMGQMLLHRRRPGLNHTAIHLKRMNTPLKQKTVTDSYAEVVRCDYELCHRGFEVIPQGEKFYACLNCNEYDLCETCYCLV